MPGGWEVLGLAGDPAPGDPGQVRGLADRLLEQASLAEDHTARLSTVSSGSSALRMRGDYAAKYTEALGELPAELAKLGKAYRGAGNALMTYAGSLEQAKSQAGTALRQGRTADLQFQGALREIQARLPAATPMTGLPEMESAITAADPAVQAAVRPAVQRARDADADRSRARRIADEAARLRDDAESRAVKEIEQALDGSGIKDKSWLQKAWDTLSTPFRSWDDFVSFAGTVAMVAGLVVLVIGTGGVAGVILAGVAVAAGAVVLADALNKYRQGRGSLGQVGLAALGVLPVGKGLSLLARGAKALTAGAATVRGGGGVIVGALGTGASRSVTSLRSAIQAGGARAGTAASTSWQRGRQFFSQDPVHFPTGIVLLPQTDVDLPGVLPLHLERTHLSSHRAGRWFGRSWASTLDQRLEVDTEAVYLATETGTLLTFPHPAPGEASHPDDGPRLALRADGDGYTVTDPHTGRTTHFTGVQDLFPVTAITDRNGNRIDVHYLDGLPTEVVHSGGYHLDIETHQGRIVEIRLRGAGQTLISYAYDEAGDLTEVTNSSGLPLRFTYDDDGRLTRWHDRIGTWYAYTYDLEGRCVYGTGSAGVFNTEISYGDGVTRARDSLGHETTYRFNDLSQVTAVTDPLGHTTRYTWDRHDRLLARTDPLGRTTRHTYDDAGAPLTTTRPDGATRRYTRDGRHLPIAITDFDDTTTTLRYDERGNLTTGPAATYSYNDLGHLTAITNALGHAVTIEHDAAGLPIAITDPSGATTRYDRDPFGRVGAVTDPLGHVTRHTWTVEGLPATRTSPGGATERWTYDAENNLTEHVDATGGVTRVEVGPFDVATARVTPDGARIEFAYDTELRLATVTDAQGLTWHYDYDPAGKVIQETDFDRRVLTYVHNPAGRLTERVNGAGQSTTYVYDVLDRLIGRRAGDRLTTFGYDALGRLTHASNPDADLSIARDADGRVTGETCNGRTLTSAYDTLGRRVLRRTPSGAETTWTYDDRDLPLTLTTAGQTIHFTHDLAGREIARTFGADVSLAHDWDADSRLRTQTLARGRQVTQRRTYGYREDGHVTEIDDLLAGRRHFDLDPVGRVTAVRGAGWSERYTYNAAGQITDAVWPPPPDAQGLRSYTGTMVRQAGRTRYEYDRQGRTVLRQRKLLSGRPRTWHYTWDADDLLTTVTTPDGTRWRYLYDPLGRRIAKERADGSQRTDFVWDGLTLAEQSSDDRATAWDWKPGSFRPLIQSERRPVAQEWIDERFYAIATDLIGTPAELVDAEGNVAWRLRQSHWGASSGPITAGAGCPLRFPGQYEDEESGLYYNFFRHYDPDAGRYLAADPIGLRGGWDPHAYVLNPLSWCDPLGLAAYPAAGPKGLPPGRPGSVVPNGMQPHEVAQAREIVELRGGQVVGPRAANEPGIDGWLDGSPISLKGYSGSSPAGVLRHASVAEDSASRAGYSGVELFVDAKNVAGDRLLDFGVNGPLAQIPRQGTISSIYVNTAGGWIVFPG
ncbi:RHS repeat-associated core domain-containing protein [Nonomuraea solani]|uniref:RHS repeat-associated core domain-containing protein n=1 Tax=Nonomuraea solani TaxID=1144553 RepID=A0A1H6EUT5_9ACTN|nr:RHS repeat-associated core domain-containing protein [Nonomuraea solani]SEH00444.1 RHS repeat-associated core domain-containing protein [Nonomuraea solani]